jgi:radical SAM/Cys-rich protein
MIGFEARVLRDCRTILTAAEIRVLQINVGFRCNQSCRHCHLACGPGRTELMAWPVMEGVLKAARGLAPELVDLTGGAPELHPRIRDLVRALREGGHDVQVRTNLTAMAEPGLEDLPGFLKDNAVGLVASLPCYTEENVRTQRGPGVFEKSVAMLKRLNGLGYGTSPGLPLKLVYNPGGPFLPCDQAKLEEDYRRELNDRFGIQFSGLFTIANMPIGRFWDDLKGQDKHREYLRLLHDSFNCRTVEKLMCRHQISVGWDGTLYDCDFNLSLNLPVSAGLPGRIGEIDPGRLATRPIRTGVHCYGCTAGAGSSCGGALAPGMN